MTAPTAETVRNVAQAKVKYWLQETAEASAALRHQAQAGCDTLTWEQQLLYYNRCYRNLIAAETTLDNLPRTGGVR